MNACRMPSIRNNQPWRIEVFTENELDALPNFVAAGQSHAAGAQHFSQGMSGRPAVMMMISAMLVCVFFEVAVGFPCSIGLNIAPVRWLGHSFLVNKAIMAQNGFKVFVVSLFTNASDAENFLSLTSGMLTGAATDDRLPIT